MNIQDLCPEKKWPVFAGRCLNAVLVLFFIFVQGCAVSPVNQPSAVSAKGGSEFNNDSAKQALLAEYEHDSKLPAEKLDTSLEKTSVDFSQLFPVFADNCVPCHSKQGNGPFELTSYAAIRKKAAAIKDVMIERLMPPFLADVHYSSLANAPRITDAIRRDIIGWIDHGCQPPARPYDKSIRPFLQTLKAGSYRTYSAEEHTVTSNSDSYQCFVIDLDLKTDTFVKCLRFHSTNTAAIHHIMVYLDTMNLIKPSQKCWDCMGSALPEKLVAIDSWSRGMVPCKLSSDFAFRFPKGAKLILQTHYGDEGNKGQAEKTSIDLVFDSKPKRTLKFEIINNFGIFFPANTVKTEAVSFHTDSAISLIGAVPHMHFLATRLEIFAITPGLEKINILKINDWNYLWQGSYFFKQLIEIPAGSTIYMNTVFDNTVNNLQQPNNPVRDVSYKTYSNEEMLVLCLFTTPYEKGDRNKQPVEILR